jgi:hypothetical protein
MVFRPWFFGHDLSAMTIKRHGLSRLYRPRLTAAIGEIPGMPQPIRESEEKRIRDSEN